MLAFEATSLWKTTLGRSLGDDPHEAERSRLRSAFLNFRRRAAVLASQIPIEQKDLTVHDETHFDALWSLLELIAGEGYPLTPGEAFVLGGAFLVHDLGMSSAALGESLGELQGSATWSDAIAAQLMRLNKRPASASEIDNASASVQSLARTELLREVHAQQAEYLMDRQWKCDGQSYYLIDDPE